MYALVRPAHAGDRSLWPGPDSERPLSRRGRQQAEGIAGNLQAMAVTRLVSSPYARCVQSLQPLAVRLGLPIQVIEPLSPGTPVGELERILADPAMDGAVLCTHGAVLDALLGAWHDRRALHVAPDPQHPDGSRLTEKAGAWIVETDGAVDRPGEHTLYYLRPVAVGPPLDDGATTWDDAEAS